MTRLLLVLACLSSLDAGAQSLHAGPEQRTALAEDGPAVLLQSRPAAASDGRDFLVLWNDDRYSGTLAARVSGNGELLDAQPMQLPLRGFASVAWSGSEYVVVIAGGFSTTMIHIGRDGSILGDPRELATRPALVAFGRTSVAIAIDDGHAVIAQTFDLRGEALGPPATVPRGALAVALGSDGYDGFAIALTVPGEGVLFCTLSRSGALSPLQRITAEAPIITLSVGGAGGRFTVVWWLDGVLHLQDVGGSHASMPLVSPPTIGSGLSVSGEFLLPMHTIGVDLDADAVLLRHRSGAAPELVPVANGELNEFEPVLANSSARVLLVWCDQMNVVYELTARDAKRPAPHTRGRDIPRSAAVQQLARGAAAGATTLLVWNEEHDIFRPSIRAGRIGANGELLDGRGLLLSDRASMGAAPQVAFDGQVFVVAWTERDAKRLAGVRVTPAGAVLDAEPFAIEAAGVGAVTLASDGAGNTAVVYVAGDELRMRVVGSGGTMTPVIPLAATVRAIVEPSVAFDGSAFLVAWAEYERNPDYCPWFRCPGPYLWSDVRGARVTDRVLTARTLLASAGRGDFYQAPRVMLARGGPAIAYRHGNQLLFARIDGQLSMTSTQVFAESIYFPEISIVAGAPLVTWFDETAAIRIVAVNDDLSRSASEAVIPPVDHWIGPAVIVPGPSFGWALYSRRTTEPEAYGLAPRTFARKVTFASRRSRAVRR